MKAIVVGTDGSETAARALEEAGDLAKSAGATLHIVSAYEPASGARVAGGDDPERAQWMVVGSPGTELEFAL